MSRYNIGRTFSPQALSPLATLSHTHPTGHTATGGSGWARDTRSELFLLAVSYMGDDTYHETGDDRYARLSELTRKVATGSIEDFEWLTRFLYWLRTGAFMRTASLVCAAEAVKARLDAGENFHGGNRALIASVLQRADEPGEMVAYWISRYGRALPQPVKRGVADATTRMESERNFLKWDSDSHSVRHAHVLNLTHPKPKAPWQDALFSHIVTEPYQTGETASETLVMLRNRAHLMAVPVADRRAYILADPDVLRRAGMTWESVAGWLQGPMTGDIWEAVIPQMGYMALLRNLRNFDDAGVSKEVAQRVAAKLADHNEVRASKQFPYRFLSAYLAVSNDRWRVALGEALDSAVANIPALPGRTLICADMSGSMGGTVSAKSKMTRVQTAALFAVALAYRCGALNVDLVGFAQGSFVHSIPAGGSVLNVMDGFIRRVGEVGYSTYTSEAVRQHYSGHDRVVIITDEQTQLGDPGMNVPSHVPMYSFNLGGYRMAHGPSGQDNRHTLGGMVDATFRMIPLLESARNANWDTIFGPVAADDPV